MATCSPNVVLAQAAAFQSDDSRMGKLCMIALLLQLAPGSTPNSLLSAGAAFQECDKKALEMCKIQLLCNIQG